MPATRGRTAAGNMSVQTTGLPPLRPVMATRGPARENCQVTAAPSVGEQPALPAAGLRLRGERLPDVVAADRRRTACR